MNSDPFSYSLKIVSSVDSTNLYANRLIKANLAEHLSGIYAIEQTMGKGQHNKSWFSAANQSFCFSFLVNLNQFNTVPSAYYPFLFAVISQQFIHHYAHINTKIKWVNDLFVEHKKLAGILCESVFCEQTAEKWMIIGIGINVNNPMFPSELQATSLHIISSRLYNLQQMVHAFMQFIIRFLKDYEANSLSIAHLFNEYNKHLYKKGQWQWFKKEQINFKAKVLHVNEQGQLVVDKGIQEQYDFGQLQWIRIGEDI